MVTAIQRDAMPASTFIRSQCSSRGISSKVCRMEGFPQYEVILLWDNCGFLRASESLWQNHNFLHMLLVPRTAGVDQEMGLSLKAAESDSHLKALHQVHLVVRIPCHVAPEVLQLLHSTIIHQQAGQLHRSFPVLPPRRIEAHSPQKPWLQPIRVGHTLQQSPNLIPKRSAGGQGCV